MSALCKAIDEYLALRRSLGFELRKAGVLLEDFASFMETQGAETITTDLAIRWATQPTNVQVTYWAIRLCAVRQFAKFRKAVDSKTEVPPDGLLPFRYHRKPPHIYSDSEILDLINAANNLPSGTGMRPATYSTVLGLLSVTGMRISEVLALDRQDVDSSRALLTVPRTKSRKSRFVPIHDTTRQALVRYGNLRDKVHKRPKTQAFFVSEHGRRLRQSTVRWTFRQLSRQTGLRGPSDRFGPRLHDFRHRLAVNTVIRWYQTGADVERHLPELATFLGHAHVSGTYWYLSAVPELLQLATARLETNGGQSL